MGDVWPGFIVLQTQVPAQPESQLVTRTCDVISTRLGHGPEICTCTAVEAPSFLNAPTWTTN